MVMSRYQMATTVGALANFAGVLALLQSVGQMSQGDPQAGPLIGGAAALLIGAILCLLGDIGKRLIRLEEQITGKPNSDDEAEDLADPEF